MDLIRIGLRFVVLMTVVLIGGIFLFAGDAIRAAAPFVVWTLAGTFVLVILVATAMGLDFAWLFARNYHARKKTDHTLIKNEGAESDLSLERSRLHLVFESDALSAQVQQMRRHLVYASALGEASFSSHTRAVINDAVPLLGEPITIKPILPELATRQRVLIVGASDSGKTTLLRHLIDCKGSCLCIDPHGSPPKWGDVKHIGQGRDYRAISAILTWLIAEMNKRYGEIGSGSILEGEHPKVTIIIDEWRAIVKNVKPAGEQISTLLTEGRKANLDIILATHSQRVTALGIQGEGDLRQGFTVVNLYGGNGEPRRATLQTNGGDEVEYALPGPYPDKGFTEQLVVKLLPAEAAVIEHNGSILNLDVVPESGQELIDRQVIDEYLSTGSYSAAFRLLYKLENGTSYDKAIGGNQTAKVKEILDRHNVTHPISK